MASFNTHGGYFAPAGYMRINTGGSHEENPYGGVQVGVDDQGTPNLLEEGEPVYEDFVFSDNIVADVKFLIEAGIPKHYAGKLYSEIVDDLFKEAEERPNDPISKNGLDAMLSRVARAQEAQKEAEEEAAIQEELNNMSPEDIQALMSLYAQEQTPQEEIYPEEQMMAPEEQMVPEGMPIMANGGNLYRFGGDDDLPPTDGNLIVNPDELLRQEVHDWYEANRDRTVPEKIRDFLTIDADTVGGTGALELVGSLPVKIARARAGLLASGAAGKAGKIKNWAKNLSLKPAMEKTAANVEKAVEKTAKALDERKAARDAFDKAKKVYYDASREVGKAGGAKKATKELLDAELKAEQELVKKNYELSSARKAVRAADLSGMGAVAADMGVKAANGPFQAFRFAAQHPLGTFAGAGLAATGYDMLWGPAAARRREQANPPVAEPEVAPIDSMAKQKPTWVPADFYDVYGDEDKDVNVERCGGSIRRANRYDWGSFLKRLMEYPVSINIGGIAGTYRKDPNFQIGNFKDILEYEQSAPYVAWTNYVKEHSDDPRVLEYLHVLDQYTHPDVKKLFAADNTTLNEGWKELFDERRNDQVGGIYHFNPEEELLNSFVAPAATAEPAAVDPNQNGLYVGHGMRMPQELVDKVNISPEQALAQRIVNEQVARSKSPAPTNPVVDNDPLGRERRKWMGIDPRYAGAIGSSLLALQSLVQKPDHYDYQPIRPVLPVGNIQLQDERYMPLDQNMATNQTLANNAGTIRAIMNSGAGPGLGAQLANADFSGALAVGNTLGNVWNANNQERNRVISANNQNATTRANFYRNLDSERVGILNNLALHNYQNSLRAQVLNNQAEQDQYNAFGQNLGNALKAVSYAGREALDRNMIRGNTALGWYLDQWMNPIYKGADWDAYSSEGGMLLKPYKKNR